MKRGACEGKDKRKLSMAGQRAAEPLEEVRLPRGHLRLDVRPDLPPRLRLRPPHRELSDDQGGHG